MGFQLESSLHWAKWPNHLPTKSVITDQLKRPYSTASRLSPIRFCCSLAILAAMMTARSIQRSSLAYMYYHDVNTQPINWSVIAFVIKLFEIYRALPVFRFHESIKPSYGWQMLVLSYIVVLFQAPLLCVGFEPGDSGSPMRGWLSPLKSQVQILITVVLGGKHCQ